MNPLKVIYIFIMAKSVKKVRCVHFIDVKSYIYYVYVVEDLNGKLATAVCRESTVKVPFIILEISSNVGSPDI